MLFGTAKNLTFLLSGKEYKFSRSKIYEKICLLSADIAHQIFSFEKEERCTFSFPKRKSTKKKLANLRFDRRCVWELTVRKAS